MSKQKNFLTYHSYHEKRYEITREILTSLVSTIDLDTIKAKKQRETMVFYSLQLADDLMNGLDYDIAQGNSANAGQTITTLADLMRANDDEEDSEDE